MRAKCLKARFLPMLRVSLLPTIIRVAKRWRVGQSGWVSLAADIQNATLSKEVFDVDCDESGCKPRTIGPITIPTMALEAGF